VSYLEIGLVKCVRLQLNYFGGGSAMSTCIVMMHPAQTGRKCPKRLSHVRRQAAGLDFTASSKGRCAGNTPMDSTSIADVRTGVVSIIQEFAEVYELFKK
jgi:hypothetical protein